MNKGVIFDVFLRGVSLFKNAGARLIPGATEASVFPGARPGHYQGICFPGPKDSLPLETR